MAHEHIHNYKYNTIHDSEIHKAQHNSGIKGREDLNSTKRGPESVHERNPI